MILSNHKRKRRNDLKHVLIFVSFGLGLAPVLYKLTDTISTDTIYTTTSVMLFVHLVRSVRRTSLTWLKLASVVYVWTSLTWSKLARVVFVWTSLTWSKLVVYVHVQFVLRIWKSLTYLQLIKCLFGLSHEAILITDKVA